MTAKMEDKADTRSDKKDGSKHGKTVNVEATAKDDAEVAAEAAYKKTARERNLILLSTLYYLYDDEWSETPDWKKVADKIMDQKLCVFGDNFSAEYCESQYNSLMQKGYDVGMGEATSVLRPPKYLREHQKRIWMIGATSSDLVKTSKTLDVHLRRLYSHEQKELGRDVMSSETLERDANLISDVDSGDEEAMDDDEYEDVEVNKSATEIFQSELLQEMVGLKDILRVIKYCADAAEFAVNQITIYVEEKKKKLLALKEASLNEETDKSVQEFFKVLATSIPDETSSVISPEVFEVPETDKPTDNSLKTTVIPLETLSSESSPVKSADGSPRKSPSRSRSPSRGGSMERTVEPLESTEANSAVTEMPSVVGNDDQITAPSTSDETSVSSSPEKNVEDSANTVPKELEKPLPEPESVIDQDEPLNEVDDQSVSDQPNVTDVDNNNSSSVIENEKQTESNETEICNAEDRLKPTEESLDDNCKDDGAESISITKTADDQEMEALTSKLKDAPKKSSSRPISTRNSSSSRLASPELEAVVDEDKPIKKMFTRQASSETHTPVLRSRRGATPTKPVSVEKDQVKILGSPVTKPDPIPQEESKDDESVTSAPSPGNVEKTDLEVNQELKSKQLRVYSAVKPFSPLSQVDQKLFDEFIDEEDDPELAMIDNNVKMTREDKNASTKTVSRKGRTVSSENTSEVGVNEEGNQRKRLTRSSLKIHDAAHDAVATNEQSEELQTGPGSEKAASESSFSEKEKKTRLSKSALRLKRLNEEKLQLFGDADSETEVADGQRVTRARAKTTSHPEKRTKLPSVGDSEGLSETEPTPPRATRSRVSTVNTAPVELTTSQPIPAVDDEDQKIFRKNALNILNKIQGFKSISVIQKCLSEDPMKIVINPLDFPTIRRKIETGATKVFSSLQKDLTVLITNVLVVHSATAQVNETMLEFQQYCRACLEEANSPSNLVQPSKPEDSDVESMESHEEQREENVPKQTPGSRRKRRRSASETSADEVFLSENKRRVTRTSTSSAYQHSSRKTKHPISPDIVSANRVRH